MPAPSAQRTDTDRRTALTGQRRLWLHNRSGCKNEVCKSLQRSVTVDDTNKECQDLPVAVSEPLQNEVCDNVVTKKIKKVPRNKCKTVQEKVCY